MDYDVTLLELERPYPNQDSFWMSSTNNLDPSLMIIGMGMTIYGGLFPATPRMDPDYVPRTQCPRQDLLNLDCVGPADASGGHGDRRAPGLLIDDPIASVGHGMLMHRRSQFSTHDV